MNESGISDFQDVISRAVGIAGKNIFSQGFDGALDDGIREHAPDFFCTEVADVVNRLVLYSIKPACGFRHELSRWPKDVIDVSSDPGPIYAPVDCPLRSTHIGCGHPEQNGLLWLMIRGVILLGDRDKSAHYLGPLIGIMKQDAMFGLMVQMGEQMWPMESGPKGYQYSLSLQVQERVRELIDQLKKL